MNDNERIDEYGNGYIAVRGWRENASRSVVSYILTPRVLVLLNES